MYSNLKPLLQHANEQEQVVVCLGSCHLHVKDGILGFLEKDGIRCVDLDLTGEPKAVCGALVQPYREELSLLAVN